MPNVKIPIFIENGCLATEKNKILTSLIQFWPNLEIGRKSNENSRRSWLV